MKAVQKHLYTYIFLYTLVPGILIVGALSYYRFMVKYDYVVAYEGKCDNSKESCFIGCEDDECTKEYYYTKVQKYAPDLRAECGDDITDCEVADVCLPADRKCSVTYCVSGVGGDTCSIIQKKIETESNTNASSTEENSSIKNTNI